LATDRFWLEHALDEHATFVIVHGVLKLLLRLLLEHQLCLLGLLGLLRLLVVQVLRVDAVLRQQVPVEGAPGREVLLAQQASLGGGEARRRGRRGARAPLPVVASLVLPGVLQQILQAREGRLADDALHRPGLTFLFVCNIQYMSFVLQVGFLPYFNLSLMHSFRQTTA